MALQDLFKSKAKKQEDEKNMNFLRCLLFMAVCDDNLPTQEVGMIQYIMTGRKGMDADKSLEEIKSLLKNGMESQVRIPETKQEKDELFYFLTSVMLLDHKIEKQEWDFLLLMVKAMYNVNDEIAHNMAMTMCKQLIDTGDYSVTEVNIE